MSQSPQHPQRLIINHIQTLQGAGLHLGRRKKNAKTGRRLARSHREAAAKATPELG